ncbi:hypothetical protein A4G99_17880 [Haladaptatus sp. R4]|uniref:DUF7289 family protein n=1 Tax=Haladaptatus sp. R4 TaxID=1679489 RepID=UPI0007B48189|nr:hypothetical protein [Haladaptatus sp. R4]KZN22950.1 hypothetical protein A4G99_17880 [Haladaptatus sp. R4]
MTSTTRPDRTTRAQSNVVGVALLLGVVMLSLASLTASVGMVVQSNAATADSARVANDMSHALAPVETTGIHRGRISFSNGRLTTESRELRVLDDSGTVWTVETDALVFTSGNRRVTYVAGAVVRGTNDGGQMYARPPITSSRRGGVLVVGAPKLDASRKTVVSTSGESALVRTNVTHNRTTLGNGTYRIAIETRTPGAWRRYFERQNATTTVRDLDDDGIQSVVAKYPGRRFAYLVVHDMRTEVE